MLKFGRLAERFCRFHIAEIADIAENCLFHVGLCSDSSFAEIASIEQLDMEVGVGESHLQITDKNYRGPVLCCQPTGRVVIFEEFRRDTLPFQILLQIMAADNLKSLGLSR